MFPFTRRLVPRVLLAFPAIVAVASLASLVAGGSPASAQTFIPDPALSTCEFPVGSTLPCPDPFTVAVTLRDSFDTPIPACFVGAIFTVESGSLDVGQVTSSFGLTDPNGYVELPFPDGLFGVATAHIVVTTFCAGTLDLCESPTYNVACTDPTPVQPENWGRVKARYR